MNAAPAHAFDVVASILAAAALERPLSGDLRTAPGAASLDWTRVIAEAARHFVLPALAGAVERLDLSVDFDPELQEFLLWTRGASLARNRALRHELLVVVAALNEHEIRPVLLRGANRLVDGLYPDLAWRLMRDLDLLVGAADLPAAREALRAIGFRISVEVPGHVGPEHHHDPVLDHPDFIGGVELHHDLSGQAPSRRVLKPAGLLRAAVPLEVDGLALAVPTVEDQLAHLIAHAQVDGGGHRHGHVQLRDRLEAALLGRRGGEDVWQPLLERFAAAGLRRAFLTFVHAMADATLLPSHPIPGDLLVQVQAWRGAVQTRSQLARTIGQGVSWNLAALADLVSNPARRARLRGLSPSEVVRQSYQRRYRGPPAR